MAVQWAARFDARQWPLTWPVWLYSGRLHGPHGCTVGRRGLMLGSGRLHGPYGCTVGRRGLMLGGGRLHGPYEVSERKRKLQSGFWIIHTKVYVSRLHYYRVVSKRTFFLVNIDDRDLRPRAMSKTNSICLSGTAPLTDCAFGRLIILHCKVCYAKSMLRRKP